MLNFPTYYIIFTVIYQLYKNEQSDNRHSPAGWIFSAENSLSQPLPIRMIDFANSAEVKQHDELVKLVEQMLALHQKVAAATNPADRQMYQRQIEMTDRAIDRLVYSLYDLNEQEIKIVEAKS